MKLAINTKIINKNEGGNNIDLAKGFENFDIFPNEFAILINRGFAFCPQVKDGHRKKTNFICSDYIAADIDEGWTVEEALAEEFVQTQASIFYTTPSHTPEHHRFRIVFELPRTITDKDEMFHAMAGIGRKFKGDQKTKDAARLFFGSRGSHPKVFNNILEEKYLTEIIELGKDKKHLSDYAGKRNKHASLQSNVTVKLDQLITNSAGIQRPLSEWPPHTSIFCPIHLDKHPSAFTIRSQLNSVGIHCSSCDRTFWTSSSGRNKYDFYFFDSAIRDFEVLDQVDEVPDENQLYTVPGRHSYFTFNEEKLSTIPLEPGFTFIKSPKNTGKTTFLKTIVREARAKRSSVLLIGHRQSLLRANAKQLGLTCYLDLNINSDGSYTPGPALAISVDSLPTILKKPRRHEYKVVLIDESEQVIAHLVSETMKDRSHQCYDLLNHYIAQAETLIVLDADMNRITVEAILDVLDEKELEEKPFRVFLNEYKEPGKRLYLYKSETHLYSELMRAIREGKRCFVACNSKSRVEKLVEKIKNEMGDEFKVFGITSVNSATDEVTQFVENIKTEILNYQVVLVSPALGTGVDITFPDEAEHIDCVFGFFSPRINTHYDIDQQLYRVRQPKEIRIWISPQVFSFETDREALKLELGEGGLVPDVIKGYDRVTGDPIIDWDDPYLDLYTNIISAQRASKNNLLNNFIELRKRNGWEIIDVDKDDKQSKEGKEIKKDARELWIEKRVAEILAAVSIDKDRHDELADKKEKNIELSTQETVELEKSWIRSFYRQPVTRELILLDDFSRLRKQIRLIDELILDPRPAVRKVREVLIKASIKTPKTEHAVIGMLLESAGLYNRTAQVFDITKVIRRSGLAEFAKTCVTKKVLIEQVLNIEVRADVVTKPVYQLNTFLKLIGLTAEEVGKPKQKGVTVYEYLIDRAGYERMEDFVKVRRQKPETPFKKKKVSP